MMSVHLRRTMELPCELQSVTVARHFTRDVLEEWGSPELVDDAQLGVSELVANAVRHARTPVELTIERGRDVRIAVRDQHPELRRPSFGSQVDAFAENGRGLQLVAAIAQDWGISARGDGKIVWFVLDAPDASAPDADLYALDGYRAPVSEVNEVSEISGAGATASASRSRDRVGAQAHLA